jgi:DNA-binding beta-propeller fold protein YncE
MALGAVAVATLLGSLGAVAPVPAHARVGSGDDRPQLVVAHPFERDRHRPIQEAPARTLRRPGQAQFGLGSALVGSAPAGFSPSAVAVDPDLQTIYVANGNNANGPPPGGNTVSVIDSRGCNAANVRKCSGPWPTITVGHEPSTLTVDPVTHTVYVTNVDDNTVSVINGLTCNGRVFAGCGQAGATVPVGSVPIGVFADDSNHTIYVGNFSDGTVSMIDSSTCNGTRPEHCPTDPPPTVRVTGNPGDIDVNQRTHTAYVTTTSGLTAFDTQTCNATTTAGCGNVGTFHLCDYPDCFGPFSAKVDPANNTIYEGDGDTTVVAIDGNTCNADDLIGCSTAAFGSVALPNPGFGDHILSIAIDVPRHSVYALLQKDDAAVVIDANLCNGTHPTTCATLEPPQIHTGANPQSIALDQRTHTIYVANQVDNTISVIDESRCNAVATTGCLHRPPSVPVPAPSAIAADETVHTVYVTSGADEIAMIDSRTCNAFHSQGCDRATTTVTVGDLNAAIAIDDTTHTAYVAGGTGPGGSVTLLDTHTCNTRRNGCASAGTLQVPAGHPTDIAVNASTGTIYVATATSAGSDVISVFDATTCNAADRSGCDQLPATMTVGPSNDCSSLAVAVAEATDTVYATDTSLCAVPFLGDQIYVYDASTCRGAHTTGCGSPIATIPAGFNPYDLAVDQATNTIYAPLLADGEHPGNVAMIDGDACNGSNTAGCAQPPALAPVGFGPIAAAIDPSTHKVFVTNNEDTSVSVIDVKRCNGTRNDRCNRATHKLAVDDYPSSIAIDSTVGTAFVTSSVKDTVSVVPTRPGP